MLSIGTVKWFDPFKGYGFIDRGNGRDIYVHFSAIKEHGFRSLKDGERVYYQVARGKRKGLMATNVSHLVP